MTESVTDVLVARARREERLTPMVVGSVIGHVCLFAVLMFMSLEAHTPPEKTAFVVTLGSPGPRTGGINQMGGRAIEKVAPPAPKPEPPKAVETPPPITPKMTLPDPKPREAPKPRETATPKPAETAVTRPPDAGEQIQAGSTKVDTGARGTGFGLSSGGGGIGSAVRLDVTDFCCPEYIAQVVTRIDEVWARKQGRLGQSVIRFTIHRDGTVDPVGILRRSGHAPLDVAALRAVQQAQLPRLPAAFQKDTLVVDLTFEYEQER